MTEDDMRRIVAGVDMLSGKLRGLNKAGGRADIAAILDKGYAQVREALVANRPAHEPEVGAKAAAVPIVDGTIVHHFVLRPGTEIALALPADLTAAEAERLAGFVKAIPF